MKGFLLILSLLLSVVLYSQTDSSTNENVLKYANQVENHKMNIEKMPIHSMRRKRKMLRATKKSEFKPVIINLDDKSTKDNRESKEVCNCNYPIYYIKTKPNNTITLTYYEYPCLAITGCFYEITFDLTGKEIKQIYGCSH